VSGAAWREVVQRTFRRLLLARVERYVAAGLSGLSPYASRDEYVRPQDAFASIMTHSPYLTGQLPDLVAQLEIYPYARDARVESFFYWSKESYGAGKPVITITHVNILRPEAGAGGPSVVVAAKQVFASHYYNAALGLTLMLPDDAGAASYLVYVNRSEIDVLGGAFGFFMRSLLEDRLRRDTPRVLRMLRARLEGSTPP
jgi:hypothetical protein